MSLDSMRGSYGRCPPFLVGGLLLVCFILTFNWWSLSSQNYDLIKQIEELGEQLKISSEEQDLCVHQRMSVEGRIRNMEEEMAQLRVRLEQQRTDNDETKKLLADKDEELKKVKKERENIQNSAVACNTELESLKKLGISKDGTIATLRLEKDHFTSQLDERKEEVQRLRSELDQVRVDLNAVKKKPAPVVKVSSVRSKGLRSGDLRELDSPVVDIRPVGLQGMKLHKMPILPQDPPNAVRSSPRFSITYLTRASPSPARLADSIGISVGGNHENARVLDLDKADIEENNAAEKVDEVIGEEAVDGDPGQVEEVARMEEPAEANADEAGKKEGATNTK